MENVRLIMDVLAQVKKAVVGKDGVLLRVLLAILAGGHVLLEDIPGVGKTTMALAFSRALDLQYQRVQFTPDVMPSDITGFSVYDRASGRMVYQPGAVLCNLFLADELNRATSRTQAALLEAMEEGRVTVDGVAHPVPQPFLVIATQNPTGSAGTQPLPGSQLDRFMLRLSIGYPSRADEAAMLRSREAGDPLGQVARVVDRAGLEALRESARGVYMSDEVLDYLLRLIDATRRDEALLQGASPRAALALAAVSRAMAFARGRDYVVPEDVAAVFSDVVAHRLVCAPQAERAGETARGRVEAALGGVKPPRLA